MYEAEVRDVRLCFTLFLCVLYVKNVSDLSGREYEGSR